MIDIRSLLKRGGQTAAELKDALARIDHASSAGELEAAGAARRAALLDDNDAAVLKAEQRVDAARIAVDRARAMDEELRQRIAEAEVSEAKAALDAERDAVKREADATAKALKAYETHAAEIVKLLQRLDAAEEAVRAVNAKLIEAGREDDRLAPVELRTLPVPDGLHAPIYSVTAMTSLRPTASQPGYGPAKAFAAANGLRP